MGIGDWGLGIGDWGLGIGPNPQSPIPISYSFKYNLFQILKINEFILINNKDVNFILSFLDLNLY